MSEIKIPLSVVVFVSKLMLVISIDFTYFLHYLQSLGITHKINIKYETYIDLCCSLA